MCCDDDAKLGLPPAVIEMLAHYRQLQAQQGWGWGEEALPDFFRWARFSLLGETFERFAGSGDWGRAVREAVGDTPPAGLVLVRISHEGEPTLAAGPPRPVIEGRSTPIDVVLDAAAEDDLTVGVAGAAVTVPAGGAGLQVVDATGPFEIRCQVSILEVDPVTVTPAARLVLDSPEGARWSITDASGGAWFASGVPHKWDARHQPFFHTPPGPVTVDVPAVPLTVVAARGIEFERQTWAIDAQGTTELSYRPARRFDPQGWHSADLHVHLNYSGDLVLAPEDARRMQVAEGLELMNLTAGNLGGTLVYDRELLESTAGQDLWTQPVARAGLEFRNDLLGHVHGLGLSGVPSRLHTGHEGTDQPWDWPPNSAACTEFHDHGATVTYAHPVFSPLDDPADLYAPARSVEARELVADAALGLVDSIELVSCSDDLGAVKLYHHLLSCGLRLTATAGTDTFLSFAHGPGVASNPPGWGRMYAFLDGAGLSVEAYQEAIRAGRTLVTNGPWLTFAVDGEGPGAELARPVGATLRIRASVTGSGVERLVIHGADGDLAAIDVHQGAAELDHEITVPDGGTWLAAAAYGGDDAHTLGAPVFAHTTPVTVDADGHRVARPASARWCLDLLGHLEHLVRTEGRFDPAHHDQQLGDHLALIAQARSFYQALLT